MKNRPPKRILIQAGVAITGLLAGWFTGGNNDDLSNLEKQEPAAVTLISDPATDSFDSGSSSLNFSNQSAGPYSKTHLLDLLIEASGRNNRDLRNACLKEWVRTEDGSGIRQLIAAGHREIAMSLLIRWTADNPKAAAYLALELTPKTQTEQGHVNRILSASIKFLLHEDPDSAAALEKQFLQSSAYWKGVIAVNGLEPLTPRNARLALEAIAGFKNPEFRYEAAKSSFIILARSNPANAIEWAANNLAEEHQQHVLRSVISKWLDEDPNKAAAYVEKNLDSTMGRHRLLDTFIYASGEHDMKSLVSWMKNQPLETLKLASPFQIHRVSDPFGGFDPRDLEKEMGPGYEFLFLQPEPSNAPPLASSPRPFNFQRPERATNLDPSIKAYRALVGNRRKAEWNLNSVNEAVNQNIGDFSAEDARAIARNWAYKDPKTAITWASGLPEDKQIEAAETALGVWFRQDREKALAYFESLPDIEFRRFAIERIAVDWLARSPEQAIKWFSQMPRGIDKDIGRREIASTFRFQNPNRAFAHAVEIDHPVIRRDTIASVLNAWEKKDPAGAAAARDRLNQ